jgi:hypothetical protein
MARTPRRCPECEGHATERVHTEWMGDVIEEVRICDDCPTEYTVSWGDPRLKETRTYD